MNKIHNTAIIGKNTIIGSNVTIGPYCVIEDGVKIGNDNIQDIDVQCLRKEIAIVPQDSVLFHNTIKHNIHYGNLSASEDFVVKAAKMAEIHDSIQVGKLCFSNF